MNLLYRRNMMYPQQGWLYQPTKQAIVGTFGQTDGKAVIKATNAYLNQLAASDRDKATALAGFINEDPMMVCSLGLEVEGVTMPIRKLVSDGYAWLDTGVNPAANQHVKTTLTVKTTQVVNDPYFFGSRDGSSGLFVGNGALSARDIYVNDTGTTISRLLTLGERMVIDMQGSTIKINGTSYSCVASQAAPWAIVLCARRYGAGNTIERIGAIEFENFEIEGVANMIPCKHNGQNGMYDMERMQWYGNANSSGSFTIPDISYTPSTP